jgi:hypothetical protein
VTAARDLLAAINGRGEPVTASDDDGRIEPAALTTWAPIPLDAVLNGDDGETHPSMLARTDGRCLLYPARVHALHAEPEALKSWLALKACAERIAAGEAVLYLDFEDSPASVVQRLLDLGVAPAAIAERFIYIRPDEPLTPAAMHDLDQALSAEPTLAVIDGVTEAYTQLGLNPMDNVDIATWLDLLPRKFARAGVTVLTLDHVVKDRENRGRYAIGGQHKLAGVDVAYSLKVLQPFARGRDGLVSITVQKDRAGRVREFAADGQVALLRAVSGPDGSVRIKLEPPEQSAAGAFRPTLLMERVSRAVEATPGLTKTAIREAVRGKAKQIDLARETLISEGYIEARHDGPQAVRHYSTTPFCMPDDANPVPPSPPRPNPVPGRAETYPVPPSHPLRKGDGGPGSQDSAKNSNPVPVCCCAIDGWPAELTPDGRCERCEGWPRPDHDPTEGS